jgi:hypothetical protein
VAVNAARKPATILLQDGTYTIDVNTLNLSCPGLVIRSASGRCEAVVVRGPDEGPKASLRNVFTVMANQVVIADLTLGYCRWHGIQARGEEPYNVAGLHVHNCRLVNCNEQFIKGSSGEDEVGVTDGIIENCLFEFTKGWAYQFYTGGIDIHKGVNWVVRDNLFRNLRNRGSKITEHAIHFWKRSSEPQKVIVEQNWIINCDRGIGFGLVNKAGGHNGGGSVIRNNMIYNDGSGPNTDVGIAVEAASETVVDHNTVWVVGYPSSIEYRFPSSTKISIRNNLTNGIIRRRDGAPIARLAGNLPSYPGQGFRNLETGDLRLTAAAIAAIDKGVSISGLSDDVEGEDRQAGGRPDIGADEFREP